MESSFVDMNINVTSAVDINVNMALGSDQATPQTMELFLLYNFAYTASVWRFRCSYSF